MRVISPDRYQPKKQPRKSRGWLVAAPIALVGIGTVNYARPLPSAQSYFTYQLPAEHISSTLDWPEQGQAAIATEDYGILATYGDQTPIATASITKVILALCVLDKLPLQPGSVGKSFTISQADVDLYDYYIANQGSRVPVVLGEELTEYQAIQALMLPSANNIAESLVSWVFGGQDQYVAYATQYLQGKGLYATHIGKDASGYDASTVSTASDLAKLGLIALKSPVLMSIAGQSEATFPEAGTITNYNTILGQNGITGLKTGNNEENPGAFLFTASTHYGGKEVQIAGSVLGANDLQSALDASVRLVGTAEKNFEYTTPAKKGQTVGNIQTQWGASAPIITRSDIALVRWKGSALNQYHSLQPVETKGPVGKLEIRAGTTRASTPLELAHPVPSPSFWWRLTRH